MAHAAQQRRVRALQLLGAAALPLLLYPLIAVSVALASLKRAFGEIVVRPPPRPAGVLTAASASASAAQQEPSSLETSANSTSDDDYDLMIRVGGGGGVENAKGGGDVAGAVELTVAAAPSGDAVVLRNEELGDGER